MSTVHDLKREPKADSSDEPPPSGRGPRKVDESTAPAGRKKPDAPAELKPAPTPVFAVGASREAVERLRRQRARRLVLRFSLFVLLPTILAAVYFVGFATRLYESHAQVTVHSAELTSSTGIDGLLGGFATGSGRDTLVVRDYIRSRDMLGKLYEQHGYKSHWQSPDIDWLERLPADASFEDAYEHYLDQIEVTFDSNSAVLNLRVRAASPDKAQEIALAIIEYSEAMVNQLSERERNDRTREAEAHLVETEHRLSDARQAVLVQQREHAELNPQQTAGSAMTVRTALEGELARARADLMELKAYMTPDAPKVRAAEERVKAISAQVGAEKARLVTPDGDGGIAGSIADFEKAMVEKQFAEAAYTSALTMVEKARLDAAKQHRYLAVVSSASLPDESTKPERALGVLTVFILSLLIMGIGSLLIASVREHARV